MTNRNSNGLWWKIKYVTWPFRMLVNSACAAIFLRECVWCRRKLTYVGDAACPSCRPYLKTRGDILPPEGFRANKGKPVSNVWSE